MVNFLKLDLSIVSRADNLPESGGSWIFFKLKKKKSSGPLQESGHIIRSRTHFKLQAKWGKAYLSHENMWHEIQMTTTYKCVIMHFIQAGLNLLNFLNMFFKTDQ